MHLIDEQDGAQSMAIQPQTSCIHLGSEVFHPCQNGVEAAEVSTGVVGDDPRQGRFANPWRTMQDHIADAIGGDGSPQQATFRKDSVLSLEFVQVPWAHAIGQRRYPAALLFAMKREEVLAQAASLRGANCAACNG